MVSMCGLLTLLPAPGGAQTQTTYTITTVAGNGTQGTSGDGAAATAAQLWGPIGVAVDGAETIYIDDSTNERLRQVPASGIINTAVGSGVQGYAGDVGSAENPSGVATLAEIGYPCGVVVDPAGNFYISDWENTIRKVTPLDIISTVGGTGRFTNPASGYALGDGGVPTTATFNHPCGLAMNAAGDIFIADAGNSLIRKIRADGQLITTVAGYVANHPVGGTGAGTAGFGGDGGLATFAYLNSPQGVAVDAAGNIFIADTLNHRIRKVTGGIITTVAGSGPTGTGVGAGGFSGDGGPAGSAMLNRPFGLTFDSHGNLFIADTFNNRIRMIAANANGSIDANCIITTVAGNGVFGYLGDGGPATSAELNQPKAVAVSPVSGRLYVSDSGNNTIRMLTPPSTGPSPFILGVVTASEFGGSSTIAPGIWIEIYGYKLAASAAAWNFTGKTAPTSLNGTTVTVGGVTTYLSYVGPGQVNAFVPSTVATGPQSVIVTTAAGSSNTFAVTVNAAAPVLWTPPQMKFVGRQYVGAVFQNAAGCIVPPGAPATPCFALPTGALNALNALGTKVNFAFRPAVPGDIITFYGIGFGAVLPSQPDGQLSPPLEQGSLATTVDIYFAGTEATLNYAGLAPNSVGVYEFDMQVPVIPASDATPITFQLGVTLGAQTLYIAVSN